jgi:hypothetical protein
VDRAQIPFLRDLLAGTGWVERTRDFGRALRRAPHPAGGLLVVGTPTEEPWHLTAHLDDEARWSQLPTLSPTLVRWATPPNAPAHLAVGLERLENVARNETVFVVAPDDATESLLERVADARRAGATIFAVEGADDELQSLAHEGLIVPRAAPAGIVVPEFDVVTHLVSAAAGEGPGQSLGRFAAIRSRLARMLDAVSDGDADE